MDKFEIQFVQLNIRNTTRSFNRRERDLSTKERSVDTVRTRKEKERKEKD